MRTGDKQHRQLLKEAANNSQVCNVCYRHAAKAQGLHEFKHVNPNNLLRHLKARHGYSPKKWYQFWK